MEGHNFVHIYKVYTYSTIWRGEVTFDGGTCPKRHWATNISTIALTGIGNHFYLFLPIGVLYFEQIWAILDTFSVVRG